LRRLGALLFNQALEVSESGLLEEESSTRSELRAALADLRFLQGFLGAVGDEQRLSSLTEKDNALSRFAAGQADKLARIADRIEEELGQGKS
jgi:hypothetical protein